MADLVVDKGEPAASGDDHAGRDIAGLESHYIIRGSDIELAVTTERGAQHVIAAAADDKEIATRPIDGDDVIAEQLPEASRIGWIGLGRDLGVEIDMLTLHLGERIGIYHMNYGLHVGSELNGRLWLRADVGQEQPSSADHGGV